MRKGRESGPSLFVEPSEPCSAFFLPAPKANPATATARYNRVMSTELKSHQLTMTVLMSPDMANFSGKVHGGAVLRLLDQVAYACASRYAGSYVVTLSVDQVMFRQPIAVGELVTFLASVNYTGTSSMEVGVKVVAEDILRSEERRVGKEWRSEGELYRDHQ